MSLWPSDKGLGRGKQKDRGSIPFRLLLLSFLMPKPFWWWLCIVMYGVCSKCCFCLFVVFLRLLRFKHNSNWWFLFICRIPSFVTVQTQLKMLFFVYLSCSFIATVQTQHATVARPTLFQHFWEIRPQWITATVQTYSRRVRCHGPRLLCLLTYLLFALNKGGSAAKYFTGNDCANGK